MAESYQEKLKRVRKPRVHITYDVETEGAKVVKELPFVMGVVGDFSGHPTKELPPLEERKFIEVNRDNFNDVMKRMNVGLRLRVENTLKKDNTEFPVELTFRSLSDFEPASVIQQVDSLRTLLDMRNRLRDPPAKVARSTELENILENVLKNTDDLHKLSAELGALGDSAGRGGSATGAQPTGDGGKES
jgi:type VI secretion system protein ImpB